MSKIGRLPITLPSSVSVVLAGDLITVKGPKGELSHSLPNKIIASLSGDVLTLTRKNEAKLTRALHGLARALLANMVTGVSTGFTKTLELVGTGYRARLQGNKLILSLGFSHEVEYNIPVGLEIKLEGTNVIHISGVDKQLVGQAAAEIRANKKPEPYKGKGVRYQGEVVRRKAGKAAKGVTA
ncbi:MAG: 50S ribosomal protein L6 [bacterium]